MGVELDQCNIGRRYEQLVSYGVEEHAHRGDLAAAAREVSVYAVRDGNHDEKQAGDDLLLAVPAAVRKVRRQHPDQGRHAEDATHRDGVGQVHGRARRAYSHYAPAENGHPPAGLPAFRPGSGLYIRVYFSLSRTAIWRS